MKIKNRSIKIKIEVNIIDSEGKQYSMNKRYIFFYLISLILFTNAGLISIILIAIPHWFNITEKLAVIILVIANLTPLLIFGIIPKTKIYSERLK